MTEIDPLAIVQINATVITGLLILLTITNLVKRIEGFWMPKAVSGAVIPFVMSSVLALLDYITIGNAVGDFALISIGSMIVGFIVLGFMIIKISSVKLWKDK
ncbi:hypothetical protein [Nitrosopumilus sp.]|uniref:hypothetical protein n=1 Tax=Nitrosopumilus sp. TaxID=2024843 RepID=UPI003D0D26D3